MATIDIGLGRNIEIRDDLLLIAEMVAANSRVLDVGCDDGSLLAFLARHSNVDARGIEISQAGVNSCVSRGLSVIQGDADTDLVDYPADSFDYAILSQTLQAMRQPRTVLNELLRVGRRAIVSFPNFGFWKVRLDLLLRGRMPMTDALDAAWYETPNIHFCTILDFVLLCRDLGITIEQSIITGQTGKPLRHLGTGRVANLFGATGVFLLSRGDR
ncbi:methionine biosynthesis protein MetW [Oceanibacterium hippocampi]|uniref:Methionine biosynthesis protein MetW n=1 Tax=Oceanibacterium hippocampi TaxID=745714 RepID=A0A1Y5RVU0_9PROT|nr:methionine biosynthesis protein MetW [Oceanibacterium hippocampi]SLN26225.1 hypothetical protein OCH7691_00804 [Oceanibacterium hippocampi]